MTDYPYATPIEKAQLELLGRVADALEAIRFALVSKIITPAVSVPLAPPNKSVDVSFPNPYRAPGSIPMSAETHVRRVLTESETENQKLGWKPYEEQKNKEHIVTQDEPWGVMPKK